MSSFISASTAFVSASASSVVISEPSSSQSSDIYFAFINRSSDVNPTSIPTGWELVCKDGAGYSWLYFKVIGASEPSTYTWEFAATAITRAQIGCYRGGFRLSDPVDGFANTLFEYGTLGDTLRCGALYPSNTGSTLLVFCRALDPSVGITTMPTNPTTGWVNDVDDSDGTSNRTFFFHRLVEWSGAGFTNAIDTIMDDDIATKSAIGVALNPPAIGGGLFFGSGM